MKDRLTRDLHKFNWRGGDMSMPRRQGAAWGGREKKETGLEGYSLPWNTRTYMVVGGTHSGLMEPKWAEKAFG